MVDIIIDPPRDGGDGVLLWFLFPGHLDTGLHGTAALGELVAPGPVGHDGPHEFWLRLLFHGLALGGGDEVFNDVYAGGGSVQEDADGVCVAGSLV